MLQSLIYFCYCAIAVFVAVVLVIEIIKTQKAQEAVLFSIILVPFILRILQLK